MTKTSVMEYFDELRPRYRAADKVEQGRLLDEAVKICGYHRKAVIRILCRRPVAKAHGGLSTPVRNPVGRPRQYDAPEILSFLQSVWHASNQACSKRLACVLRLWLPYYESFSGVALSLEHQVLILRLSPATIDRLLAVERSRYRVGKGRATTKPGTLLKKRIPIKTNQWDEDRPGFLEVDTVAHCGTTTSGMYAYTLNTVDIASGWVEPRAIWGKGETGVVDAIGEIENVLPFRIRGVDVDNGSEVLNHHMEAYLTGRKRKPEYTRSREYKKNDNAHIEGRNWTHIRQYLGYERFDNPAVVALMNDLFANEYSLLINYFLPSVKLQEKERLGSRIIKRHDKPMTPCDRLLASRYVSAEKKQWLKDQRASLNPFLLHMSVRQKIRQIFRMCSLRPVHLDLPASGKGTTGKRSHTVKDHRSRSEHRQLQQQGHQGR